MNNLTELKTITINPTDTTVLLLSDCTEVGCLKTLFKKKIYYLYAFKNDLNNVFPHSIIGTLKLQSSSAVALE